MELSELTAYALERHGMREERRWAETPGLSLLCHPETGNCVALLIRQWDSQTGRELQFCDLNCGQEALSDGRLPWLSRPLRMRGARWLGIRFDEDTDPALVFRLFDRAAAACGPQGYTIVLEPRSAGGFGRRVELIVDKTPEQRIEKSVSVRVEGNYADTPLPKARRPVPEPVPPRLRRLQKMFSDGRESPEARAERFYRQARFMEDYEDDVPWTGYFARFFPGYQDLSLPQLRGYFTWRAQVRRGEFRPIATSAAYLYVYELLNGVGAAGPEDALRKLRQFEAGYLDSGVGDARMRENLRRWMLEYAVLTEQPPALARELADPALLEQDAALGVLRSPEDHSDGEVFAALCRFAKKSPELSPVLGRDPEGGRSLFSRVWRAAAADRAEGRDHFALCFGARVSRRWYPLANAVWYSPQPPADRDYALDESRVYRCRGGVWTCTAYESPAFDRARFQGFLHETDARLRRFLSTGRYLKEAPGDAWALPYIESVVEAERQAALEAARPKLRIDLSGLDRIRREAAGTRDSLLTEEERAEELPPPPPEAAAAEPPEDAAGETPEVPAGLPLDPAQLLLLRALLRGEDPAPILQAQHLMPSVAADFINEALYDALGDSALLWEDGRLRLAEDYRQELEELLK